jgi:hypothetical protein
MWLPTMRQELLDPAAGRAHRRRVACPASDCTEVVTKSGAEVDAKDLLVVLA